MPKAKPTKKKPEAKADLVFIATIPPLQSALTMSGDGDMVRIKLDIPLLYAPEFMQEIRKYTGKVLKVSVKIEKPRGKPRNTDQNSRTDQATY